MNSKPPQEARVFEKDVRVGDIIPVPGCGYRVEITRIHDKASGPYFYGRIVGSDIGWQANADYMRGVLHGQKARLVTTRRIVFG